LCKTHCKGSLSGSWFSSQKNSSSSDLAFLDHFKYYTTRLSCCVLAYKTLTDFPGLQRIIQTKTSNMAVSTNALHPRQVAHFLGVDINFGHRFKSHAVADVLAIWA